MSILDKFSDPKHPKRKSSIALKIILIITTILGIAVLAVSAYYIYSSTGIGGFAVVTLVLGIGIIGFSIVGLFGSGYYYEDESKIKIICLRVFWYAIFFVAGILLLVGAVCVLSSETIEYYIIMNLDKFFESAEGAAEDESAEEDLDEESPMEKVAALVGNVVGVGIMSVVTGVILIIPFVLATYLMGARMFLETVGIFGSCVIAVLGIGAIALAGYFYNYMAIARQYSGILLGIIVLGVFLIVLGIIGFFGYWCERNYKWPIRLFAVLLIATLLAFFIIAIVGFGMLGSLKAVVDEGIEAYCGDEEENWEKQIQNSDCYQIVTNVVNYLCENNKNENNLLDPCPEALEARHNCSCTNLTVDHMTKEEFFGVTADYTVAVLRGNYMVVGLIGFVIVLFLILMLVTVFATCVCYKKDEEDEKHNLEVGAGGEHGDIAIASPHGFMKWGKYNFPRVLRFKGVYNTYKLNAEDIFKYATQCQAAFRALGKEKHREVGAERAAKAIGDAMQTNPDNKTKRAREVCDTCVNIYSQINYASKESIGFIYVEVNKRLRNAKSLPDDSIESLKKVVKEACGPMDAFVFLLWEGLKTYFTCEKETVYRGMRIPLTAHQAMVKQVGKYIVLPAFTSFSVEKEVAMGFPGLKNQEPEMVDVMWELQAFGRPLIEDMVYNGVKHEREVLIHPFSVFKVVSESHEKGERPVVRLSDVEVQSKSSV